MTTDLTGDFELGEDEFDWDVFLPDPDEADVQAEAAALDDEAELSLDDSDFDWDGALREDAGAEDADSDARAGAAYDRIVDTVRRSFEDEPSTEADNEPEAETSSAFDRVDESETLHETAPDPVVTGFAGSFAEAAQSEADVHRVVEWAPTAMADPDEELAGALDLDPDTTWRAEPPAEPAAVFVAVPGPAVEPEIEHEVEAVVEPEGQGDVEPGLDQWLALDDDLPLAGTDPEPAVAFEPPPTTEPVAPRFAEAATTVGMIGAVEAARPPSSDIDTTWAMAPAEPEPEPVDDPAASTSDPLAAPSEDVREKPKRSLVFKATVVLACLCLLVVAAVVAVRALHHPTTAPPAHVTTPTQATGTSASGARSPAAASGTARIQAATDAVDSATTAASVGLTSLSAFPTPTNVETVINPYISSLQLYETFLSGTKVPASAQSAATSAEAKIRQDLQFLETIDGLPPQELGAFLVQFDTDATQLQTTLSTLEQDLRTPSS